MLVERSMHPAWLSNAYLVGDEPGGTAVLVDSGAPLEPLLAAIERERLTPTHLLVTHGHADHVAGNDELVSRFDLEVTSGAVETGGLHVDVLATPGHSDDGVSFVVGGELCFTGDTLFRDAVGGGPADEMRRSVMDVLMALSPELRVLPGHTDETTIGREWEENPFVRFWRGLEPEDGRACRVHGDDAVVVVWSPDYDAKGKALVRFAGRRGSHRRRLPDRGSLIPVKLHRCRWLRYRFRHPCWTVQEALDEQGVEYELVVEPSFPRGRRKNVIEHTGQHFLPAVELEDGSWWREDSKAMAAAIRNGRLG